jgi:hypothetical protein
VNGTVADVALTKINSAANDATLNIASANGTCTGLTAAPTSANSTAGVAGDWHGVENGQYCADTTGLQLYQNTGDTKRPVWTLV